MLAKKKIIVLISGNGSNLQSIIDACKLNLIYSEICLVISNKPDALGLKRAEKEKIPTITIDHKDFKTRDEFDDQLLQYISDHDPDLIVLAGFMRILSKKFVKKLQGKLMNIHPSLLPKYKGLNTHERAIQNGDEKSGLSIHFVTEELDGGPIIYQKEVYIDKNESASSLSKKIMIEEHKAYPKVIKLFIEERIKFKNESVYLDDKKIPKNGINFL